MSVDIPDDEGDLPVEPGAPAEPGGRYENFVIVGCFLPDGKLVTIHEFTIFADHCLDSAEIEADIDFFVGPLCTRLMSYPRLAAAAGGQISMRIIGTTCGIGHE